MRKNKIAKISSFKLEKVLDVFSYYKNSDEWKKLKDILENYDFEEIKKLIDSETETYDITLDDDTHAFVANGFIVHNTGRKLAVDNYGPQIPIGGGAMSSKDCTKVDRSGAYMARKIAVDYLKEYHEVSEVYVKLAYSIGVAEPVMVSISVKHATEVDQHNHLETDVVNNIIKDFKYDLTPKGIIDFLELKKPQFQKTAEWGHMGDKQFLWNK